MVVSSLRDDLKLLFSDDYRISDSDYNVLSEILVSSNISDIAFDGLIQTIKLLHDTGATLPISVNLLKHLWEEQYIGYNFVKSLVPMSDNGFIEIKRVATSKLLLSKSILFDVNLEDTSLSHCAVIYPTDKFNILKSRVVDVLSKYKFKLNSYINEGVELIPQKVKSSIDKANKVLQDINVRISIESYMKDTSLGTEELNLVVSGVSDYTLKDKEIQRIISKNLKGLGYVTNVEAYKESKKEIYIGIIMKTQSSYNGLHTQLINAIQYLEVNGVKEAE